MAHAPSPAGQPPSPPHCAAQDPPPPAFAATHAAPLGHPFASDEERHTAPPSQRQPFSQKCAGEQVNPGAQNTSHASPRPGSAVDPHPTVNTSESASRDSTSAMLARRATGVNRAICYPRAVRKRGSRLLFLALAIALAVWLHFGRGFARHETVALHFGATAGEVREADLHFQRDGAATGDLTLHFPDGAAADVTRELRLRPGDYDVAVRVVYQRTGSPREWHVTRRFTAGTHDAIDLEVPR